MPKRKTLNPPDCLYNYIMGHDAIPSVNELSRYKGELFQLLCDEGLDGYITLYRGFSSIADKFEIGEIFMEPDAVVSFTQSKQTAIRIAEERSESNNEYGYAIRIQVPTTQIYFHHGFDKIGKEHSKEKEVIINPYGFEWDIVHYIDPSKRRQESSR